MRWTNECRNLFKRSKTTFKSPQLSCLAGHTVAERFIYIFCLRENCVRSVRLEDGDLKIRINRNQGNSDDLSSKPEEEEEVQRSFRMPNYQGIQCSILNIFFKFKI